MVSILKRTTSSTAAEKIIPLCIGLLPPHFHVVIRNGNRGRRAGAINDILNVAEGVDCIALFDVDSRPNPDFLVECVRELTETSDAVLASGCRYVTNKVNTLTKIASIEYKFFCDIYHLFGWSRGFIQFNGVIGVSKASFLKTTGFDERCSCEDLDISEKIYLSGNRALLATTKVGEQAPTSIQDLYNQRVRWFRGAVEGFRKSSWSNVRRSRSCRSKSDVAWRANDPIFFILIRAFYSHIFQRN